MSRNKPKKTATTSLQEDEKLVQQCIAIILKKGASVSQLQRCAGIGYGRAARIMDELERRGIVGPAKGNNIPRQVLIAGAQIQPGDQNKKAGSSSADDRRESCNVELNEKTGKGEITAKVRTRIHTKEQLLKFAEVDETVWEVERFVVNSWEVAMAEPATTVGGAGKDAVLVKDKKGKPTHTLWTRGSSEPLHEQLFQVKAYLRRKAPIILAGESLLRRIQAAAPILPKIKHLKPAPGSDDRSLEICIMDPHLGLLCQYPEADGPWNLELAAEMILQSLENLIERAKPFGPFREVFAPFGNDFVHSDTVFHTTTAGTAQPEAISWHAVYEVARDVGIRMVDRLRSVAPIVKIYEVPGNHSRQTDYTLAQLIKAYFRHETEVMVDASSSPYKFHRCGVNLIGYEHGHSVAPIRLAALMANECRKDWRDTEYREWHLGDQHRKGAPNPATFEEQGVSVEYIPGLTAPNEWHRLKSFSHQKRGAAAFVWDWECGQIAKFLFNVSQYHHKELNRTNNEQDRKLAQET